MGAKIPHDNGIIMRNSVIYLVFLTAKYEYATNQVYRFYVSDVQKLIRDS